MSQSACPICRRPVQERAYAPFCSRRCADLDLQRWFSGAYVVAAGDEAEDEGEPVAQAGRRENDLL